MPRMSQGTPSPPLSKHSAAASATKTETKCGAGVTSKRSAETEQKAHPTESEEPPKKGIPHSVSPTVALLTFL